MATVTSLANPAGAAGLSARPMDNTMLPYSIWQEIDLAAAVTAKGSALAQADVIEALRVPADHAILAVYAEKTAAMTGTSADLTFDIGITGGDVDNYVDGWDFDAAAVGDFAAPVGVQEPVFLASADTIDILFATQTGTVTGGKVVVGALVLDLSRRSRGAIAALKS
jgi:hypothetical protein